MAGLPVCTIDTIVTDLLHEHEDESAVAQIVQDARRDGLLDDSRLLRSVNGYARCYGHPTTHQFIATLTESNG